MLFHIFLKNHIELRAKISSPNLFSFPKRIDEEGFFTNISRFVMNPRLKFDIVAIFLILWREPMVRIML